MRIAPCASWGRSCSNTLYMFAPCGISCRISRGLMQEMSSESVSAISYAQSFPCPCSLTGHCTRGQMPPRPFCAAPWSVHRVRAPRSGQRPRRNARRGGVAGWRGCRARRRAAAAGRGAAQPAGRAGRARRGGGLPGAAASGGTPKVRPSAPAAPPGAVRIVLALRPGCTPGALRHRRIFSERLHDDAASAAGSGCASTQPVPLLLLLGEARGSSAEPPRRAQRSAARERDALSQGGCGWARRYAEAGPFTAAAELVNGRLAMLGVAGMVALARCAEPPLLEPLLLARMTAAATLAWDRLLFCGADAEL